MWLVPNFLVALLLRPIISNYLLFGRGPNNKGLMQSMKDKAYARFLEKINRPAPAPPKPKEKEKEKEEEKDVDEAYDMIELSEGVKLESTSSSGDDESEESESGILVEVKDK